MYIPTTFQEPFLTTSFPDPLYVMSYCKRWSSLRTFGSGYETRQEEQLEIAHLEVLKAPHFGDNHVGYGVGYSIVYKHQTIPFLFLELLINHPWPSLPIIDLPWPICENLHANTARITIINEMMLALASLLSGYCNNTPVYLDQMSCWSNGGVRACVSQLALDGQCQLHWLLKWLTLWCDLLTFWLHGYWQ